MPRKKRNNLIEDMLESFFELTGLFWQVGAVITCLLFVVGLYSVDVLIINHTPSLLLDKIIPWAIYILPTCIFLVSFIFGVATYSAYKKQNYYG